MCPRRDKAREMGAASGYEFAATGAVWEISLRTESLMVAKDAAVPLLTCGQTMPASL
jgi:hypothetical protein